MGQARAADVLIVSLGSTTGLRSADEGLAESLRRAGASVEIVLAQRPREVRTMMLTDLQWARAARVAAEGALRDRPPRAVLYSSTTAALLWRRPGAIRFDAPASGNRPGWDGLWQRPLERARLRQSPLLLPLSDGGLREAPSSAVAGGEVLVLGLPVERSGPAASERDITAITYAANPLKKGLDRVLAAWRLVRAQQAAGSERLELVVAGTSEEELRRAGIEVQGEAGIQLTGPLPAADYRALLRRSRIFLSAPRREDYGAAQLEALADGCLLVSTPAPGPYVALGIARELDGRLVDEDLAQALGSALRDPPPLEPYRARALAALEPLSPSAIDRKVAQELLPRLLSLSS